MHIWGNYIFNVWNDIAKIACSSKFECSDQVQKSILRSDCHTYQCLLDFKQSLHGTDTANIKRKMVPGPNLDRHVLDRTNPRQTKPRHDQT